MKKSMKVILILVVFALVLGGCSANKVDKKSEADKKPVEDKVIKVASHTKPMTTILEMLKDDIKKEGYKLDIMYVSDNVQANVALKNKEVDANFFQHKLFMQMFNKKNNANLVSVQPIYDAIVSYYGKNVKKIDDIKEGMDVGIPSDPTNMTRALRLLAENKVITLKDPNSFTVNVQDIKENPKKLKFSPISLLNLNKAYEEKDFVFNYPAYIGKINLTPKKNGIMFESGKDLTFAITLVAREDNKNSEKIKVLKKAMTSKKVKDFITKNLDGKARVSFK